MLRTVALPAALALALLPAASAADPPATPTPAAAAPAPVTSSVGLPRAPDFALESTAGVTRRLGDYAGRVVILLYEDRDSNQQNDVLKRELAARARREDLTRDVSLVPVANLSAFNFWPARGFARDAVVDIARQQGHEIMIDWSGSMAGAWRFRAGQSHVVVIGRDGRVLFRVSGALSERFRAQFFEVITQAVRAPERVPGAPPAAPSARSPGGSPEPPPAGR